MRTSRILILASVAMILITTGIGSALADSFGGQAMVSHYDGLHGYGQGSAFWSGWITSSGTAQNGQVSWYNNWHNDANTQVDYAYGSYVYPQVWSFENLFMSSPESLVGPGGIGGATATLQVASGYKTIYDVKHEYQTNVGEAYTWDKTLYFN